MDAKIIPERQTYAGLFMVALATLMYEILLTRIFSVTMFYHFAFVAVSLAMFGMSAGAILVYLFPDYFIQGRVKYHLALSSLLFAVSIVVSFLTHLSVPFAIHKSIAGMYSIVLTYTVLSVPFTLSGICVCLALTRFPLQVGELYAADLAGAAAGCVAVIYALNTTDGPTAVIIAAFLASVGAVLFACETDSEKVRRGTLVCSLLLAAFAAVNGFLAVKQSPLLQLMWVKGAFEPPALYEKWNSFSRIRVSGDPNTPQEPFHCGFSLTCPSAPKVRELSIEIDAHELTILTGFNGNLNDFEYLKHDVMNLAHHMRSNAKVLFIGVGGGRDILSALVFGQKSVLGIDINENIIDTAFKTFGDFTGHLDRNPRVTIINDEARSYIARSKDRFDIIQASGIFTWVATPVGAFVLTENTLYTVEAWKIFLNHLNPNGVLSFSHWYVRNMPGEMYKLASLACASLTQLGIENPRKNIIVVRHMPERAVYGQDRGVGTILVSKEPFSDNDLDTIEEVAGRMHFDVVLSPRVSLDSTFAAVASGKDADRLAANLPINITAPTDDRPFFFYMLRLRNILNRELWEREEIIFDMKAVVVLGALLVAVVMLTFLYIIVPLTLTIGRTPLKEALPLFIFFACIGLGFMLVEISQVQRLIIFLGHPTYSLSVVLFTLLLSGGLGSYSTQKTDNSNTRGSAVIRLLLLVCTLFIFGKLTPYAISMFEGSVTAYRILVATLMLFPLGLFMGMAFPLGMKVASSQSASLTPWLWGINGATSVCASVLAVAIALSSGISTSFWAGFSCYVVAFIAFVWASGREG